MMLCVVARTYVLLERNVTRISLEWCPVLLGQEPPPLICRVYFLSTYGTPSASQSALDTCYGTPSDAKLNSTC